MAIDPRDLADRIVHGIDPELLDVRQKIALAAVLVQIAQVDEHRTRVLLEALRQSQATDEADRVILRAVIRRRLRVLPPPAGVDDGLLPNGGD